MNHLVGRDSELGELRAALADARRGHGRLVLLFGDAGLGKTCLARELTAIAERDGMSSAWGGCREAAGRGAFAPWVQILRRLAGGEIEAADAAELVRALPADAAERPHLIAGSTDPAEARFQLFHAVADLLRRIGDRQPLVLVLDDLDSADLPSLFMLRFIAGQLRDTRVLIVGTCRPIGARADPQLGATLADIAREGRRLTLKGLSAAEVAVLLGGSGGDTAIAERIHRVTAGNPLFVTEFARLLVEEGVCATESALPIPEVIREVVRRRLAPLTPAARSLLRAAAVVGGDFDAGLLREVLSRPCPADDQSALGQSEPPTGAAVVAALEEACAAGFLESRTTIGRFGFAHDLVRETLHEDLSGPARAEMHAAVAAALEKIHAADLAPHLATLARHHIEAAANGDVAPAVNYSRRAGDQATKARAYEEAAAHYQRAIDLQPASGNGAFEDIAGRARLLLSLGEALWGAGDLPRMRDAFQQAAAVARALPAEAAAGTSPSARGEIIARAAIGFGGRQQPAYTVYDETQVALLEEALRSLPVGDDPLRARVLARLAYALYSAPQSLERRRDLCDEAVRIARALDDATNLQWVLNDQRWALWSPATIEERIAISEELMQLAVRFGDRESAITEHGWRIVDRLELGDGVAAAAEIETYARLARDLENPWYEWYLCRFGAMQASFQGRLDEAEALAEKGIAAAQSRSHDEAMVVYVSQLLHLRFLQGRAAELEVSVRAFVERYPAVMVWRSLLALVQAELGRETEARSEFERAASSEFADLPDGYLRLPAAAYLTEACVYLGDERRAVTLYGILEPYAAHCIVVGFGICCLGSVEMYLGMLASLAGRPGAAAHFEAALAIHERLGAVPALARTRCEYGRLLLCGDGGDRSRGHELLRLAEQAASEHGLGVVSRRLQSLQAQPKTEAPPELRSASFRLEGDFWAISFDGISVRLRQLRGLSYIARLLERPGIEIHVADLASPGAVSGAAATAVEPELSLSVDLGDAGEALDRRAASEYRQRLRVLRADLEELEGSEDFEAANAVRSEIEALEMQLSEARGFGGHERRLSSHSHRARVAVAKAIRAAVDRVVERAPALGEHFRRHIRTGVFCSYEPDPERPVQWLVERRS